MRVNLNPANWLRLARLMRSMFTCIMNSSSNFSLNLARCRLSLSDGLCMVASANPSGIRPLARIVSGGSVSWISRWAFSAVCIHVWNERDDIPRFRRTSVSGYTPLMPVAACMAWGRSTSGCTMLHRLLNCEGLPNTTYSTPGL